MSTTLLTLYTQNHWLSDGVQTLWDFTFQDGYIDREYVKAYRMNALGNKTQITVTNDMFVTDFRLQVPTPTPAGDTFVIYRDTPKNAPLVNFEDGGRVAEVNLDLVSRQAIHCCAEIMDQSGVALLLDEYGFKSLKHIPATGASVLSAIHNGRGQLKTDATPVTVPNTLPTEFLSTIINDSGSNMNVAFDSGVAYMQGGNGTPKSNWTLAARSLLHVTKIASGVWYISGAAS